MHPAVRRGFFDADGCTVLLIRSVILLSESSCAGDPGFSNPLGGLRAHFREFILDYGKVMKWFPPGLLHADSGYCPDIRTGRK